jgi:hypothetical protein
MLGNESFDREEIVRAHLEATLRRMAEQDGSCRPTPPTPRVCCIHRYGMFSLTPKPSAIWRIGFEFFRVYLPFFLFHFHLFLLFCYISRLSLCLLVEARSKSIVFRSTMKGVSYNCLVDTAPFMWIAQIDQEPHTPTTAFKKNPVPVDDLDRES